jgi:hypothetical protein
MGFDGNMLYLPLPLVLIEESINLIAANISSYKNTDTPEVS